jgi:poly-gamma-glutamate biosynthesis protein PgsC/CapC
MDTLTLSIAIGLVVSLLFTEFFGLSAGGMIVPGYLALQLDRPLSVLATLVTAVATFLVVRAIGQVAIVYGRRRIVLMVLVGFVLGSLWRAIPGYTSIGIVDPATVPDYFRVIGYIIPGLIALWMDRQGWLETVSPLLTSSVVVRLVLLIVGVEVVR